MFPIFNKTSMYHEPIRILSLLLALSTAMDAMTSDDKNDMKLEAKLIKTQLPAHGCPAHNEH